MSLIQRSPLLLLLACGTVVGCSGSEEEAETTEVDPRLEKCPKIQMDAMEGKWIKVNGNAPDQTFRFQLTAKGGAPVQGYTMWYTGGHFSKRLLEGERRENDFKFTEVPTGERKAKYEKGEINITRLYVEPKLDKCALRISELEVKMEDGAEKEIPKPGFQEYLPFPDAQADMFTFRPCDGELFLGDAAKKKAVADKQVEDIGMADPNHMLGEEIPVAAWTSAEADGDAACSYDMDLYFDDRTLPEGAGKAVPAGEVVDGFRHWYVEKWSAPYSGNHHFQIFRYKTCEGGERELVGVSCLESVLN